MPTDITKRKREAQILKDEPILSDIFTRLPQRVIDEKSVLLLEACYKIGMSDTQACASA